MALLPNGGSTAMREMIDPDVLNELIRLVEATRGQDHPVAALLRRAAQTNALKDHVQALKALDALTTGTGEEAPGATDAPSPADADPRDVGAPPPSRRPI